MRHFLAALALSSGLFVPLSVSDDFNRTDSGTLGANWTAALNGGLGIISNEASAPASPGSTLDYVSIRNGTWDNNQSTQAIPVIVSASAYPYVGVRCSGSGGTLDGYVFYMTNTGDYLFLLEDGVVNTQLASYGAVSIAGNDVKIEAISNVIHVYTDTGTGLTEVGSGTTDSTYSSGSPCLGAHSTAASLVPALDDFLATGESGGAASFIPAIINAPVRGGRLRVR